MNNSHPTHGLITFINGRFCEHNQQAIMIINHEHVGEFVFVWYWGFWGSIIKRHYTFANFLCSIGGLGVH